MKRCAIVLAGMLSACGPTAAENEARNAIASALREPESARFRDVKVYKTAVCGEVNGKNAFGAYSGYSRFWYDLETRRWRTDPGPGTGDQLDRQTQEGFNAEMEAICKDV